MYNFVETGILQFLERKPGSSLSEIVQEFPNRNPGAIKASLKALVESGDIWSEGSPEKYTNISASGQ